MNTWQAVDEERSALADDLAKLGDSDWDVQSLCSEWKVRHVVGHLIGGADVKIGPFLAGMPKSGLSFNGSIAVKASRWVRRPRPSSWGSSGGRSGRIARRRERSSRSCSSTLCATAGTSADRGA